MTDETHSSFIVITRQNSVYSSKPHAQRHHAAVKMSTFPFHIIPAGYFARYNQRLTPNPQQAVHLLAMAERYTYSQELAFVLNTL